MCVLPLLTAGGMGYALLLEAAHCEAESGASAIYKDTATLPQPLIFPLSSGKERSHRWPCSHQCLCRHRLCRTGCMIRPPSSMTKHIPQFCGVFGHTFMEFLEVTARHSTTSMQTSELQKFISTPPKSHHKNG